MTVAILYQEGLKEYDFGSGHPFRGDRFDSFMQFLAKRLPPDAHYKILTALAAGEDDLSLICDRDYIDFVKQYYQALANGWMAYYEGVSHYLSVDNQPAGNSGQIEQAARLIIGQARTAVDLVQRGQYPKVISVGGGLHHAKQRFGEGFCVYNDVAFAALYAIRQYQLERVLVIDTDAHAGNGTAEYLRGHPGVLYIDIHQDPRTIYPGTGFASETGVGQARGLTVNLPMPPQAGDAAYKLAFDEIILPVTREYRPQLLIRCGGSDPHFNDGLTNLGMTAEGFHMMGEKVRAMSQVCAGKQIDLIASGYNAQVLSHVWLSLLSGISDWPLKIEEPFPVPDNVEPETALLATRAMLEEVKRHHRPFWKCFR
ncbi:MAG TPA: histone deacetylase family protein [Dehalococcoidales bacterium]|nr:histone deacetylase family protein [Dehalococcoidales bacterium]